MPVSVSSQSDLQLRTETLRHLRIPVWLFDVEALRFVWANDQALMLWNAGSLEELKSRDLHSDISNAVGTRLKQYVRDLSVDDRTIEEHWTLFPKGDPQSYECIINRFILSDGQVLLQVHALKPFRESDVDTLYRSNALLHTSVLVSVYDARGFRVYSNPMAREVLGGTNRVLSEHFVDTDLGARLCSQLTVSKSESIEAQVHTRHGSAWHSLTLEVCPDPISGASTVLVSETDISERRRAEERVHELAYTDTLTGLLNRASFHDRVDEAIAEHDESGRAFGILFLDLDRFKLINDSLGHSMGDQLLEAVARRLIESVSKETTVARVGGDEFMMLMPECSDGTVSVAVADQIVEAMRRPFDIDEQRLSVTPSIGISSFPEQGLNLSSLMRNADLAMYAAKADGGGRRLFEQRMADDSNVRLQTENDLRAALAHDQIRAHYQPKIDVATGAVTGMEALCRWHHPVRGMIPPLDFVGIAEESDLISELTRKMLRYALEQQCLWQAQGHTISIAVNISPRDFRSGKIVEMIEEALLQTGCDPEYVELEITESTLMAEGQLIQQMLTRIKALGVKLSIDDFGVGYSNLRYLQKFPLDSLKIDRSFTIDPEHAALLKLIVDMGKMLSLTLVAEGVESGEQMAWLTELGCDQVQGYWFSRPMDSEAATEFLETHKPWVDTQSRLTGLIDG